MANNLLIVPGMTGCKLLINETDVGWPVETMIDAWLAGKGGFGLHLDALNPETIVETFKMDYPSDTSQWAPRATTLRPGSNITAGPTLKLAYNQLTDFNFFDYDWRADVRQTGRLLLNYLKNNKPGADRWKLIGHSLGGLVTVVASKLCAQENGDDDTAFSQLVSHAVLLASPLDGTMVAADALINGDNLSAPFSAHFKEIVKTWPSIHQLLPAWFGSVKRIANGSEIDQDYSLLDDAPWVQTGLDPSMLSAPARRGRFFQRAAIENEQCKNPDYHVPRLGHEKSRRYRRRWKCFGKRGLRARRHLGSGGNDSRHGRRRGTPAHGILRKR